jgi:hypothetical protein
MKDLSNPASSRIESFCQRHRHRKRGPKPKPKSDPGEEFLL